MHFFPLITITDFESKKNHFNIFKTHFQDIKTHFQNTKTHFQKAKTHFRGILVEWIWVVFGQKKSLQRWARMAFWLQYQDQESWNPLKISISKSRLLKLAKNSQNQYQHSWKKLEGFNINIKIFGIFATESISISWFLKCVKKFKTKINFIEKVKENSISKSKFLKF